jgi:hypothetical protein
MHPDAVVRRLRWAWPVAILVGFPIGGFSANLVVGAVDSIGVAVAGGVIAGAIIGAAQWLALRPLVPWQWLAATSVRMAIGSPLARRWSTTTSTAATWC